jgi:hypothetical protein
VYTHEEKDLYHKHLHNVGLEAYSMELIRTINDFVHRLGNNVHVIPAVLVPIAGIDNSELIRRMADLDSWIMTACPTPNTNLGAARAALWDQLMKGGGWCK